MVTVMGFAHFAHALSFKMLIFLFKEGHKILRNLHLTFVLCITSQK
jgi:hypothetical protein